LTKKFSRFFREGWLGFFPQENKGRDFYRFERSYAGFYRRIPLTHKIYANKAKAAYKDGVLEISAPKITGTGSPKKIEVK